jgi:cardiolipin synthase
VDGLGAPAGDGAERDGWEAGGPRSGGLGGPPGRQGARRPDGRRPPEGPGARRPEAPPPPEGPGARRPEAPPPPEGHGPRRPEGEGAARVLTVPNLLSLARILLIPAFVGLLLVEGNEVAGLVLVAVVVSTDWVDGYLARRTGQVTTLGKVLDPVADRLVIGAAVAALVARGAFPLWAALLVVVRDGVVLVAGALVLLVHRVRLDVRWVGKVATFALMCAIPLVAWGNFGLFLHQAARVAGWGLYWTGIALAYAAALVYAGDLLRAVRASRAPGARGPDPRQGR